MAFDVAISQNYFQRLSTKLFEAEEDRECFVSECMVTVLGRPEGRRGVKFAAKAALRDFLKKQRNIPARGPRRELVSDPGSGVFLKAHHLSPCSDIYMVPENPKDREHLRGYWVDVNGSRLNFSVDELVEISGLTVGNLRTRKRRGKPIVVRAGLVEIEANFVEGFYEQA